MLHQQQQVCPLPSQNQHLLQMISSLISIARTLSDSLKSLNIMRSQVVNKVISKNEDLSISKTETNTVKYSAR